MDEEKIVSDEVEEKEANYIAAMASAGEGLVAGLKWFMPVNNSRVSKHQMGKRGAKHEHKPTFKSRQILPMSAAQYRRYHFGAKNKKKEG